MRPTKRSLRRSNARRCREGEYSWRLSKGLKDVINVRMTGGKEDRRNAKVVKRNLHRVDGNQIGGRAAMFLTASRVCLYTAGL